MSINQEILWAEEMAVAGINNPGKLEFSNACLKALSQSTSRIPVIKRLYPSLLKAWAYLTWSEGYKVKRWRGILFLLNYRSSLDRQIGLRGGYESENSARFFSEMKKGCDVFFDIGASMGIFILQVAQHGLAKEIHAFEPDPRNYAQMMFNIYLNVFKNIQAHQEAISNVSGPVQFELATETHALLSEIIPVGKVEAAGVTQRMMSTKGETCQLMARALDDVFSYQDKKIFLKIAIQGHELDALKGATRLLGNNKCFLQVYIWPENYNKVSEYLAEMGYKLSSSRTIMTETSQNFHFTNMV